MNPTMFELSIVIFMAAVTVAMVVYFQRYLAATSAGRMTRMMTRIGLDPAIATGGNLRSEAIMLQMRQRCRRCPSEALCEHWLAGNTTGDNSFCPNARIFGILAQTAARGG